MDNTTRLSSLRADAFEELVAELIRREFSSEPGVEVQRLTGAGDTGADVLIRRPGGVVEVVEAKTYPGRKPPIFDLAMHFGEVIYPYRPHRIWLVLANDL